MPDRADRPRRAAVLGSPIAHSRSPQLHLAAYRALGLADWTYERIECSAGQLPALVGGLGPEWVGLSVTMPGKFAALQIADERTARAELVGSANTLVRIPAGWRADNTDVDGVTGALREVTGAGWDGAQRATAVVVGSGGTAPAAVVALAGLGARHVTIVARNPDRAAPLTELAGRVGMTGHWCDFVDPALPGTIADAAAVVSTVPADAAAAHLPALAGARVLLDAIYDPWPTPLAAAVTAAGGQVVSGLHMLLHQAFTQVSQFTGCPAPEEAMRAALQQA
ncbi:shikimate dehydrogenase [Mycobacterium sp. PS03-16]|uniref:shikimate dehydrogenase n=1 Tax=Mycobacterium sp. PS03-16 TaxID=2559611 RepID=UPI001073F564|nr:shikimate dehydrogenase [Mycobacterium sp. PS03-16]TFV58885.1 shikimate dehydrogenase [Mycobacterium sp. PS03-16]